jgi:hypothetical protein
MNHIEQIIDNKELQIGKLYVYVDNFRKEPIIAKHEKGKFQNEQHEKDYLASQGAIYMLRNLETEVVFDLHTVDYLEYRYKIYPVNKYNLGFILSINEFRNSKTNQRILLKHFYANL